MGANQFFQGFGGGLLAQALQPPDIQPLPIVPANGLGLSPEQATAFEAIQRSFAQSPSPSSGSRLGRAIQSVAEPVAAFFAMGPQGPLALNQMRNQQALRQQALQQQAQMNALRTLGQFVGNTETQRRNAQFGQTIGRMFNEAGQNVGNLGSLNQGQAELIGNMVLGRDSINQTLDALPGVNQQALNQGYQQMGQPIPGLQRRQPDPPGYGQNADLNALPPMSQQLQQDPVTGAFSTVPIQQPLQAGAQQRQAPLRQLTAPAAIGPSLQQFGQTARNTGTAAQLARVPSQNAADNALTAKRQEETRLAGPLAQSLIGQRNAAAGASGASASLSRARQSEIAQTLPGAIAKQQAEIAKLEAQTQKALREGASGKELDALLTGVRQQRADVEKVIKDTFGKEAPSAGLPVIGYGRNATDAEITMYNDLQSRLESLTQQEAGIRQARLGLGGGPIPQGQQEQASPLRSEGFGNAVRSGETQSALKMWKRARGIQ